LSIVLIAAGKPEHHNCNHADYIPSVFSYTSSPVKKRLRNSLERTVRRTVMTNKRRASQKIPPLGKTQCERGDASLTTEDSNVSNEPLDAEQLEMIDESAQSSSMTQSAERRKSTVATGQLQCRTEPDCGDCDMMVQTDLYATDIDSMTKQIAKVQKDRNAILRKLHEVEMCGSAQNFGMSSLVNDDDRCKFYTGLPYSMIMIVYKFLSPHVKKSATRIKRLDEMFIVFVKLRLNLLNEDIGYRFGISGATVSRIFHKWLNVMYDKLSTLICWPDRDSVRQTLPVVFHEKYTDLVCIIDCTEIFIERPFGLHARACTYSNYKKHNTVKYLLGITPTGSISFVSQGWGGRVTDDELTRSSGFLEKLLPGDLVMADRGFRLQDDFAFRQCKLVVPAFTRGKKQLSAKDVECSRTISNVRIHIERVIGVLKNRYTLLQGILPITLVKRSSDVVPTVDKIMTVCAALCNLGETVVPTGIS
jgi:hypothetical protein